jgi:hypothetical protein
MAVLRAKILAAVLRITLAALEITALEVTSEKTLARGLVLQVPVFYRVMVRLVLQVPVFYKVGSWLKTINNSTRLPTADLLLHRTIFQPTIHPRLLTGQ